MRTLSTRLGILVLGLLLTSAGTISRSADSYQLFIFQGSDWCSNCIRFENQVLQDSAFIRYSKQAGIKVQRVDFPQRKRLDSATVRFNEKVADKFGFKGVFPTVMLVRNDSLLTRYYPGKKLKATEFITWITRNIPGSS